MKSKLNFLNSIKIPNSKLFYLFVFLSSSLIPFTHNQAEAFTSSCVNNNSYLVRNTLDNTINEYMSTDTQVCGNNVRIKRTLYINPNNIDQLLAVKQFDTIKTRQIEQICLNLLNVNEQTILNNAKNNTSINQQLKCKFVFKETNIFKISKGNANYLRKVATLFNKIANFNVTIVGGAELNIDTSVIADNNSTSVVDYQLKTALISRTKQKNVAKLWRRASDQTTDYFRSLLTPSSVIDVKCNDTTNGNINQTSTNGSTSGSNVANNLTCDVQASQTNKVR